MKNPLVVGPLMLVLGIAIGWIVKPVPAAAPASATGTVPARASAPQPSAAEAPANPPGAATKRSDREKPAAERKLPPGVTEEQLAEGKKMQARMMEQMVKRQRASLEGHIGKLAAALNITDAQRASLETWLDGKFSALESADFTDEKATGKLMEDATALRPEALEETLAASLSSEQKTALDAFREGEHQKKVDTAALKSLSKIQGVIDFEEGQRDEIYKLLSVSADADLRRRQEKPDPSSLFTESMGMDMDPYGLGIQQLMTESAGDFGKLAAGDDATFSEKDWKKRMREAVDKRIEEKVEVLRPVLTDTQLERYREELKTKGLGFFSGVLQGD